MAFKIDVTFNGETFTQEVGQFLAANLAEAMTNAVNEAAESSRLRLMEYMGEAFDRPRPITVDSVGILPAKTGSRRSSGWISRSTAARAAPATRRRPSWARSCPARPPRSTSSAACRTAS